MKTFLINTIINDPKLNEVLGRLDAAREEIYNCYKELQQMGVVELKNAPSDDDA